MLMVEFVRKYGHCPCIIHYFKQLENLSLCRVFKQSNGHIFFLFSRIWTIPASAFSQTTKLPSGWSVPKYLDYPTFCNIFKHLTYFHRFSVVYFLDYLSICTVLTHLGCSGLFCVLKAGLPGRLQCCQTPWLSQVSKKNIQKPQISQHLEVYQYL